MGGLGVVRSFSEVVVIQTFKMSVYHSSLTTSEFKVCQRGL